MFCSTGINKEKLWLHYNFLPVGDHLVSVNHIFRPLFYDAGPETCRSIAEVEGMLHQIQRTDGMMLFVVDGKTDEFAIFGVRASYILQAEMAEK
jgi:hypothetical protein